MRAPVSLWVLRLLWVSLPFSSGAAVADALDGRSAAVRTVAVVLAWAAWAVTGAASFVTIPLGLTVLRLTAPLVAAGAVVAGSIGELRWTGTVGAVDAVVVAVLALSAAVADHFVDGASYGDERRFALRLPAGFVVGVVPVAWAALSGGLVGGALLLAARAWVAGTVLTVVGAAVAIRAVPAFHGLSNRWLVMVPAGITLVDHLALAEPVLFRSDRLRTVGPAPADTDATDLSGQALGTPIEIRLDPPVELTRRLGAADAAMTEVAAVLVSPASVAEVLRELDRRSGGVFPSLPGPA